MEYPQVYRNDDGVELIALNEVQAAAFEKSEFKPVGRYVPESNGKQK